MLQKSDLLSDRRGSVIDEFGIRFKIDRKVRRDSSELLGVVFQLICISAEYFDDRLQMFFHSRYSKETTPAAEMTRGWVVVMYWFVIASVLLMALLSSFYSGNESGFRDWLM